jgi:hypothetical protein
VSSLFLRSTDPDTDLVCNLELPQDLCKRHCKIGAGVRYRKLHNVKEHAEGLALVLKVDCHGNEGLAILRRPSIRCEAQPSVIILQVELAFSPSPEPLANDNEPAATLQSCPSPSGRPHVRHEQRFGCAEGGNGDGQSS